MRRRMIKAPTNINRKGLPPEHFPSKNASKVHKRFSNVK
jgi:hypothetical protein